MQIRLIVVGTKHQQWVKKAFQDYGRVTGVGTRAVPTTFIINREGFIVKTYRGARPGNVFYQDLKPYL